MTPFLVFLHMDDILSKFASSTVCSLVQVGSIVARTTGRKRRERTATAVADTDLVMMVKQNLLEDAIIGQPLLKFKVSWI